MGQAMTSETLCISGNDGHRYWVGLQAKASSRGWKKTVYKGVLLGYGPRQWEKVVAKSFSSIPGTKESWSHEVKKADVSKKLAVEFAGMCPSEFKIRVVIPGLVQMDKVSKVNRWLEHRHGHRSLDKDEWISIEEHIPGRVYRFCPWERDHDADDDEVMASDHLQTFSHFTYKQSNGDMVACDFQGIIEDDTYIFTDSIIHSRLKCYGPYDAGDYGMTEFFKRHRCTRVCKDWPKPTPLSPPPSFDNESGNTGKRHVRFDLTPFENVVFPSQRLKVKRKKKTHQKSSDSRRRHESDHDARRKVDERQEARRQEERGWYALTDEEREQCRHFVGLYPSLSAPEDNPPAYSQFDYASSYPRNSESSNSFVSSFSLDETRTRSSSLHQDFANENAGTCGSLEGIPRRSCLKKTHSEDHSDIMTTRDFNLPSAFESQSNSGLGRKKSLTSKDESPPTDSSYARPMFDLEVPANACKSDSTNTNTSRNGTSVHSSEIIKEEGDETMDDCETLDSNSKHSGECEASAAHHAHQTDSCSHSPPKSGLMERRRSKDKGHNPDSKMPITTMNDLKLNLPPLQPSAPQLSDSES